MSYGNVKVGRLTLTESLAAAQEKVNAATGVRSLGIRGQESMPPLSLAELTQRHSDIAAMPATVQPVIFTDKADRSGYYQVTDSGADLANWQGEVATSDWQMQLQRIGTEHEIDLESRLSGPQSRQNDHGIVGERIHAPSQGAYAYAAGASVPSIVTRTSADGALTVYRGVPVNVHPRWACPLDGYLGGRARFLDGNGYERSGVDIPTTPTGWTIHNGLVRVMTGSVLDVAAWSGGEWQGKTWDLRVSGSPVGTPRSVTLLRNEPEAVVIRLTWTLAGPGRVTADITLRRGHRFAEVYVETQTAATIRFQRATAEAAATTAGQVTATVNDAAGNRYWAASARTVSQDATNGALHKGATTTLGLAVGAVVGGSAAVAGDTGADLMRQYIGAPSERVEGVRR